MKASHFVSGLFFLGLVLLFAGERIVSPGTSRWVADGAGLFLVLAACGWRQLRVLKAQADRRKVERALLGLMVVALSAVALYFAQSDLASQLGSEPLSRNWPRLAGALSALWPVILSAALLPLFLMELAYAAMASAPQLELGRMRDAMLSGLGLAGALVFAFSAQYVASERDLKWDLSYFRTARAGEATKKIVQAFDAPVKVSLFFPPANEVAQQVAAYLDDLKPLSPFLQMELLDQAIDSFRAKELGVNSNGAVVVQREGRKELLLIGQELEKSRAQLKNLDSELQRRFLLVAREKKTVYLTTGHGERLEDPSSKEDLRATVRLLRGELKAQNYELKPLGAAEGLASQVPDDAGAVLILGPQHAFSEPEALALRTYFEGGGRLLIAIDPETGAEFEELLAPLGLVFTPKVLANDVAYAKKSHQLSDRTIIGTATFSTHPSVTTNGRGNLAMYLMGAGLLEEAKKKPANLTIDFAVRAHPASWVDLDGNFQFDPPQEIRRAYGLSAAIASTAPDSKKNGRALVLADSDALADEVLPQARGNAYFALDGLKWLLGDEEISGSTIAETDVPIQRTRALDSFWFYSTIFLGPAVVLAAGALASRRRRVKKVKEATP